MKRKSSLGLKKLWKLARQEQALAHGAYRHNLSAHAAIIVRRDLIIDMIAAHPKCPYTRSAVSCRIIDGLSGREDELKNG